MIFKCTHAKKLPPLHASMPLFSHLSFFKTLLASPQEASLKALPFVLSPLCWRISPDEALPGTPVQLINFYYLESPEARFSISTIDNFFIRPLL